MSDNKLFCYALLTEARERTQKAFNARILREQGSVHHFDKLTLCSIASPDMPDAIDYARDVWPQHYAPETFQGFGKGWDHIFLANAADTDLFDLAIWQEVDGEPVLAALALGTPSNARTHLTLKWVERFHGHTHIEARVIWAILTCAEEYAKLLGSERVLVKDPLVPQMYEHYGYSAYRHPYVAHGGNYLAKELKND